MLIYQKIKNICEFYEIYTLLYDDEKRYEV